MNYQTKMRNIVFRTSATDKLEGMKVSSVLRKVKSYINSSVYEGELDNSIKFNRKDDTIYIF